MINWLAVIGVVSVLVAIPVVALFTFLALLVRKILKTYHRVETLMSRIDNIMERVETRVEETDEFISDVQDKARSAFRGAKSKTRRWTRTLAELIRAGLHVANDKRKDSEDEDFDGDYDARHEYDEFDDRPRGTYPRRRSRPNQV